MKYSIQNNTVDTCPTLTPSMLITCRSCNVTYNIIGTDIPTESYSSVVSYDDIESSIEQSLDKRGWQDLICNTCIELNPEIVKIYNDSEDRHED